MEQDDLTLGEKNAQFLKLFHEEDQRAVEDWICRNRAEEPYTVPRRDRKSTLLYAVLDRARANGDLREIEPIWDYYLPNKNEPLSPDKDSYKLRLFRSIYHRLWLRGDLCGAVP